MSFQLLDSYFEAYQHALELEERFALAQVITDIIYKRPRFDFHLGYFVNTYKNECTCLRLQLQLVRGILNQQVNKGQVGALGYRQCVNQDMPDVSF